MTAKLVITVGRTALWFRLIGLWAWRTGLKYIFWATLPVGVFSLIPIAQHWTELSIRIGGASLQGWGLLYIAIGIARTRQQFDLPSVPRFFAQRLREFPRYPATITGSGASMSASMTARATGTVTMGTAEPLDVESRIAALEKNFKELTANVANQHGETLAHLRRHDTELEAERTERVEQGTRLKSMLHQTATGGLDLAVYGVIVVFVATLYCTFSQEIAAQLGAPHAAPKIHSVASMRGCALPSAPIDLCGLYSWLRAVTVS